MRIDKLFFRPTEDEKEKIESFLRGVIRRSRFSAPENYEEVNIEMEKSLYLSMLKWCAEKGIDEEILIQALFRFVGDPGNREEAKLFLLELQTKSEMEEFAKFDLSSVYRRAFRGTPCGMYGGKMLLDTNGVTKCSIGRSRG